MALRLSVSPPFHFPFTSLPLCYSFAVLPLHFAHTCMRVLKIIPAYGEALLVVMMAGFSLSLLFCCPPATLLLSTRYSFAVLPLLFAHTCMRVLKIIPASGEALLVVMMAGFSLSRHFCCSFAVLPLLFAHTCMRVLKIIPAHGERNGCLDGVVPVGFVCRWALPLMALRLLFSSPYHFPFTSPPLCYSFAPATTKKQHPFGMLLWNYRCKRLEGF